MSDTVDAFQKQSASSMTAEQGDQRYESSAGHMIGMKTFGASSDPLQRKFGFEPERVVDVVRDLLGRA